jgi:ketosteroid isomerase-like protein
VTSPTLSPDAATPAGAINRFSARLNAGDLEGALACHEAGACFRPSPEGAPVHGLDAIRSALEDFLALAPTLSGRVERVLEADGVALLVNRWRLRGGRADGQPVELSGVSADALRRRSDGTWGILVDDPWGGDG